jgi:hypothetical protein
MILLRTSAKRAAGQWHAPLGWHATATSVLALTLSACAPALDWREVRPAGTPLQLLFPCKPRAQQRTLSLAAVPVAWTLQACQADSLTWALSHADVADPVRVAPALAELKAAAQLKMGSPTAPWGALTPPGATPNVQSGRARFATQGPDKQAVQTHVAVFAHGTRVFQATVLGQTVSDEAANTFFSSLRVLP